MNDIYKEHILDHYSNPRNRGVMEKPEIYFKDSNPLCGDELAMYAKLDKKTVKEASFIARGCAISLASASMLTEEVKGKNLEEIKAMTPDDMTNMLMIPISAARIKCAILALKTLQAGIAIYERKHDST